mmetsp:Transcript_21663/g.60494  ORF Transcript_21663/g.60494 Transcript_21663/m.60494 type:complete len:201 (+) Transcript_21663:1284-1886(+)
MQRRRHGRSQIGDVRLRVASLRGGRPMVAGVGATRWRSAGLCRAPPRLLRRRRADVSSPAPSMDFHVGAVGGDAAGVHRTGVFELCCCDKGRHRRRKVDDSTRSLARGAQRAFAASAGRLCRRHWGVSPRLPLALGDRGCGAGSAGWPRVQHAAHAEHGYELLCGGPVLGGGSSCSRRDSARSSWASSHRRELRRNARSV